MFTKGKANKQFALLFGLLVALSAALTLTSVHALFQATNFVTGFTSSEQAIALVLAVGVVIAHCFTFRKLKNQSFESGNTSKLVKGAFCGLFVINWVAVRWVFGFSYQPPTQGWIVDSLVYCLVPTLVLAGQYPLVWLTTMFGHHQPALIEAWEPKAEKAQKFQLFMIARPMLITGLAVAIIFIVLLPAGFAPPSLAQSTTQSDTVAVAPTPTHSNNQVVEQPQTTTEESECITHIVQPGENLFRIALRYGSTVVSITERNGLSNPDLINSGQALTVCPQ